MWIRQMDNFLRHRTDVAWGRDFKACNDVRAALEGLDDLERAMDAKWQDGRLRALSDAPLREKFDRQRDKLLAALQQDDASEILTQCSRMATAWRTLDSRLAPHAQAASQCVVECKLSTGDVLTILQSSMQAFALPPTDGNVRLLLNVDVVARAVEQYPAVFGVSAALQRGATAASLSAAGRPSETEYADITGYDDPIPF